MARTVTLDQLIIQAFHLTRESLAANVVVTAEYQVIGPGVVQTSSRVLQPTASQQTALNAMWLAGQNAIVATEAPDPAKVTPA
jgi:hypothetical protein